jgi:hypothetical protein
MGKDSHVPPVCNVWAWRPICVVVAEGDRGYGRAGEGYGFKEGGTKRENRVA